MGLSGGCEHGQSLGFDCEICAENERLVETIESHAAQCDAGAQQVENLRAALQWALAYIGNGPDCPEDGEGELFEDYSGATRLAWPDNPEQWA